MKTLQDQQMEELSDLFGRGRLSNAQQIANLLKIELDEPSEPAAQPGSSFLQRVRRLASSGRLQDKAAH